MSKQTINIVHEVGGKWILPRFARALVEGIPNARAVSASDPKARNALGVALNYYVNDHCLTKPSSNLDVAFIDHPKENFERTLKLADHVVAMAPQYQRLVQERGKPCDLVIQPVDTNTYSPRLVLGFVGRFKGKVDYSERKGRDLLDKVAALPWVELRMTLGDIDDADMPAFYRGLDYVLVTSEVEGGPMCLTEGLACGKRSIMPSTLGIGELFKDGLIDYPAGDFDALQGILEVLYGEKQRLADMVAKYTWGHWVEQHVQIFGRLTAKPIEVRSEDRAVVVVATPAVHTMSEITLPSIRRYAERCNARLVVWSDVPDVYQHAKYRLMALRDKQADRVLHLDADCCPRADAPDIFAEHEPGRMYMWDEKDIRKPDRILGFQTEIDRQTGDPAVWDGHWWNPGVMLCDREHLKLFEMPPWDVTDDEHLWYGNTVKNQPWLNWRMRKLGIPVQALDRRWNYLTSLGNDTGIRDAHILHFGAERVPDAWDRKLKMARLYTTKPPPVRALLATVVAGDAFQQMHAITGKYHRAYAERFGWDYRVITEPIREDWPSPSWWKLDLYNALEEYEAVVFIDADAWPWPHAPSILDAVPPGRFGAFNSWTLSSMKRRESDCMRSWRHWVKRSRIRPIHDPLSKPFYCNGGVWVCWNSARDVLLCSRPVESPRYVEQHWLNWSLYQQPDVFHALGREWNWGHLHAAQNEEAAMKANIAHLNGVRVNDRMAVLERMTSEVGP